MECPICEKGKLEKRIEDTTLNFKKERMITIRAEINKCDKCGEVFLDEKQASFFAKKLDETIKELKQRKK